MKKIFVKIMLFCLPFMALVLATTNNSVELINMADGTRTAGSYFTLLNDSAVAICPVLAGFCSILALVLAVVFLFRKKYGVLRVSAWLGFAGACFAVIPVAARGETLMLPNVFFPILMLAHFILCAFAKKLDLTAKDEPQGRRLPGR